MNSFYFRGTLPASKSILNRALIALSYNPDLKIIGDSNCEDVRLMQQGLTDLLSGKPVDCGHAGTVLRFLALRASRIPGRHVLTGSDRLFQRPQDELLPIMGQLSVDVEMNKNSLVISSARGWRLMVDGLQIQSQRSSQFASALVLNSWGLKFPLHFHISRQRVSESYFRMTMAMMRKLGMRIEENGSEFFIPANQQIVARDYRAEIDMSSAFAVAALAAVAGEAHIENVPANSLQPDSIFISLLKQMGIDLQLSGSTLVVNKTMSWSGVSANLENSPDLFPVLGVLCALASTESHITGVSHLKYKESSRLDKTSELMRMLGAEVQATDNAVSIRPAQIRPVMKSTVVFDVAQDHRMVMAAAVARRAGFPIQASDVFAVEKSFPEFIAIEGGQHA